MKRCFISLAAVSLSAVIVLVAACPAAQERATPKAAKGGQATGEPWLDVPDGFRNIKLPEFPIPESVEAWSSRRRGEVRRTLLVCLGDLPPRPKPVKVRVISISEESDLVVERFEFFNGVDSRVPGILMRRKDQTGPAPAIVALHGHGSSKESVMTDDANQQAVGRLLARRGYVVAAIDGYFGGERLRTGPAGSREDQKNSGQEASLFKLNLWLGRSLWGMMLRDEQILLDYLETRPDVDRDRIGATGMSMGCTRSWWLAAIDERVKAIVGVACFTRYTELIAHGNLRYHGIYYFVPNVMKHFDTEAIYGLVAPRPMLMLSGDQDPGAPTDGIEMLEQKVAAFYRLYGADDRFRSVVYAETGHEYLPEMKQEMVGWFETHLPVAQ